MEKGVVYAVEWDSVDRDSEVRLCEWSEKIAELCQSGWVTKVVDMWGAFLSAIVWKDVDLVISEIISGC